MANLTGSRYLYRPTNRFYRPTQICGGIFTGSIIKLTTTRIIMKTLKFQITVEPDNWVMLQKAETVSGRHTRFCQGSKISSLVSAFSEAVEQVKRTGKVISVVKLTFIVKNNV